MKTNVLKAEMIADTLPLDRAVNVAEVKMLKPQNKKLIGKIRTIITIVGSADCKSVVRVKSFACRMLFRFIEISGILGESKSEVPSKMNRAIPNQA